MHSSISMFEFRIYNNMLKHYSSEIEFRQKLISALLSASYTLSKGNFKWTAAAFIAQDRAFGEVYSCRLTNLGGGTATLRLLSATSMPFWAQATNRNAMKNCWGEQKHSMWHKPSDHTHLMHINKQIHYDVTPQGICTCLLREPLRSESAKSQIYGDTDSVHIYYNQHKKQRQQRGVASVIMEVFSFFLFTFPRTRSAKPDLFRNRAASAAATRPLLVGSTYTQTHA